MKQRTEGPTNEEIVLPVEQGLGSGRSYDRFHRFHFRQNVVILLLAIPSTYLEAAATANRFRFRFQNPAVEGHSLTREYVGW